VVYNHVYYRFTSHLYQYTKWETFQQVLQKHKNYPVDMWSGLRNTSVYAPDLCKFCSLSCTDFYYVI
jgi:hypothetical protein